MNIILIGMPGCGKSTVGVLLAKTLNLQFLDTDLLIQKRTGRFLQDIINEDGIDGFLKCEEDALLSVGEENTLIATGGSAIYSDAAMRHLKRGGITVYMKVSPDELNARLHDSENRGIAMKKGESINSLYAERAPLYEKYADIIIEEDNSDVYTVMEKIKSAIKGQNG